MKLSRRMREAADVLYEVSQLYNYRYPEAGQWSAEELRAEAIQVAATEPDEP